MEAYGLVHEDGQNLSLPRSLLLSDLSNGVLGQTVEVQGCHDPQVFEETLGQTVEVLDCSLKVRDQNPVHGCRQAVLIRTQAARDRRSMATVLD